MQHPKISPIWVLFLALVVTGMGQTIVFAVLPMLGRTLGFNEFEINSLVSAAALMYFLSSPRWGRASDRWGRKRVIIIGLGGYVIGTLCFNLVAGLGLQGVLTGTTLFIFLMLGRMLLATIMSASQPASMAYMADITTAQARVKGFSKLSAASNIGTMAGPLLAQFAFLGLLFPLYLHAGIALVVMVLVWRFLPVHITHERPNVKKLSYFDPRYRSYLLTGLIMFTMFGVVQQTLGYYFQDTLHLDARTSASTHGLAMMASSAAMLFSQLVLVQRMGLPPQTLLRVGLPLAGLAFAALALAHNFTALVMAMTLFGLGMGLASPGYAAGATMRVEAHEQGGIAGLIASAPGLGFVIGPLLGAGLYKLGPSLPYWAAAVVYALLVTWLWRQKNEQ